MFDKFKQEWEDTPRSQRWFFIGIAAVGFGGLAIHAAFFPRQAPDQIAKDTSAAEMADGQAGTDAADFHARTALPTNSRNQGLEDLSAKIDKFTTQMSTRMDSIEGGRGAGSSVKGTGAGSLGQSTGGTAPSVGAVAPAQQGAVDLDQIIQAPTFSSDSHVAASPGGLRQPSGVFSTNGADAASAVERAQARLKVWEDPTQEGESDLEKIKGETQRDQEVVPVNAGIESVLLSGFNARPSGSVSGAVGSSQSANSVGAPFVTRLKGDAILPNGWRVADLGDCYLGGSATAVLSAERAYAIADQLSCVKPNGEVYEGAVKAYALDVDGTLGLACKVVSKQGSLLMQAALTGMVSGIGAALSPSTIPTYNSNGSNGSTQSYQYPNVGAVAATSAGAGVQQASAQLSKFYLQYASEVFPVCEVVSTTRATWVLREAVVLTRRKDIKESAQ